MTYNEALKLLNLENGYDNNSLKKVYRMMLRKYHPDFYEQSSKEAKMKALEMTKKLNEAYEILSKAQPKYNNYYESEFNKTKKETLIMLDDGLDVAASEFYEDGLYNLKGENRKLTVDELINFYKELCANYPIISIEDPVDENDWDGFVKVTKELGDKIQLVGDDLFVTNKKYLQYAIDHQAGNAILLKVNQIGTITETLETIELAKKHNYKTIISHRSGETEDTTIADLAVGLNLGQIKTGSLSRTDRICKYNQLLRIEEELER